VAAWTAWRESVTGLVSGMEGVWEGLVGAAPSVRSSLEDHLEIRLKAGRWLIVAGGTLFLVSSGTGTSISKRPPRLSLVKTLTETSPPALPLYKPRDDNDSDNDNNHSIGGDSANASGGDGGGSGGGSGSGSLNFGGSGSGSLNFGGSGSGSGSGSLSASAIGSDSARGSLSASGGGSDSGSGEVPPDVIAAAEQQSAVVGDMLARLKDLRAVAEAWGEEARAALRERERELHS
ncbi:unnamed protein product, partial [Laminaria digitata]